MTRSIDHLSATRDQLIPSLQDDRPILIVTVDVEEEFDWTQPFSRSNTSIESIGCIHLAQRIFEHFGIVPTYVIDYPVASQGAGYEPLKDLLDDEVCLIGAQLHPWVNPPFVEDVTIRNSFPGNLFRALEKSKLRALSDVIAENLTVRPTIYKAGRYGIGPNTVGTLKELGYRVDLSICSYKDYRDGFGPDFRHIGPAPFWFGKSRKLLGIPLTCGFIGLLRSAGPRCYPIVSSRAALLFRTPGVLARLGLLNRVTLTPEGTSIAEAKALTRKLLRSGVRIFSLAFHSPSLQPGNTPYVRDSRDLALLLDWLKEYFEFFTGEIRGQPSTPLRLLREFERTQR